VAVVRAGGTAAVRWAPLLAVIGVSGLVALVAWPASATARPVEARSAQTTFLGDCAVCHGADAGGSSRGPSLRDDGPASVDYWVSTGRMPLDDPDADPERGPAKYSPREIRALVSYISDLTGKRRPAVPSVNVHDADLSTGAVQYELNCAACHATTGVGGALFKRAAPPVTRATAVQAAEAIRVGPGQMPAFGRAALTDQQVRDTAAYVRYLDDPDDRGGTSLWHVGPLAEGAALAILGLGPLLLAIRWIGTRR
jgi:ubiquinol-cytochrome c reductase cytochrome c subunit